MLPLGFIFKSKQLTFSNCFLFFPDLPVAAPPEQISSAVNPFRRPAQPLQVRLNRLAISLRVLFWNSLVFTFSASQHSRVSWCWYGMFKSRIKECIRCASQVKRGSLLSQPRSVLQKLASISEGNPLAPRNSRGFLFQALSPQKDSASSDVLQKQVCEPL